MKPKVLITGCAGFIGSHLAEACLKAGWQVWGIDNFSTGDFINIVKAEKMGLQFVEGDILHIEDYTFVDKKKNLAVDQFDIIYHLAALPRIQYSIDYPIKTNRINIEGTLQMLEYARRKAKRFIFISSSAALEAKSPYALQKLTGEYYCSLYSQIYKLATISTRLFNVYGKRMNPNGDYACLIPKHLKLALLNKPLPVYGNGENRRDFTYVDDVTDALIKAGELAGTANGLTVDVGMGKNKSVKEVDRIILGLTKSASKIKRLPARKGEPKTTKAVTFLPNWKARTNLKEGIKKLLK